MPWSPLTQRFFDRPTLGVARALLGQLLVLQDLRGGSARVGRIVETEAYIGPRDLACHSSKGRTARTEVMFGPPGHAYVFLIYGMHCCFNVVTGNGAAVLIRALEPVEGFTRRADGPGRLTQAMGITRAHNGLKLDAPPLWLAEGTTATRIARGPRIGVDYAKEWAAKPYRFWERDNPHVSVKKGTGSFSARATAAASTR
jgi:DNA-3-methyladenine glycosylase